jgi:hypothetical protein
MAFWKLSYFFIGSNQRIGEENEISNKDFRWKNLLFRCRSDRRNDQKAENMMRFWQL